MKKLYKVKLGLLVLLNVITISSVVGQQTWYALNNVTRMVGETAIVGWANYDNWTEDPAAQVFSNPGSSVPANGDHVVIRAGKEITLPAAFIVNTGTVTVDGTLYIEGATDSHVFTALRGSGRVYIRGSKLPAGNLSHFNSAGPGAGTVVLRGEGPISITEALSVYNLEIEMSASDKTVTLSNNVTVNGSLNVKRGRLLIGSTTARTLDIKRNVFVQSGGHIGVSTQGAYHNMIVWGDFKNYGSVKFSNAAQYAAATNGALRLTFKGATNNDFVVNGSTELYRLFVEKGDNDFFALSVTSNNVAHFKLLGPYEKNIGIEPGETIAWQSLPLVVRKGTLKLGANVVISNLGYLRNGTAPNEFFIPEGAGLWINGAQLNSGIIATPETWHENGTGISVGGNLRITAGSLTNPAASSGIAYRGSSSTPSNLIIEGGEIFTTQLRAFDGNSLLNYKQSGGTIDFYSRAGAAWTSPVFNMPKAEQVFEMSGGTMIFRVANTANVSGIRINIVEENANVSGGLIEIHTPSNGDFKICSTSPLFNLATIGTGSSHEVQMTNEHGSTTDTYHYGDFSLYGNLTIGVGSKFNAGAYNFLIGGDLTLAGAFLNNGMVTLNGSSNALLANNTGSEFKITKLDIIKNSTDAVVSLSGSSNFSVDSLFLSRGDFDVADKTMFVSKSIILRNGSLLSSSTGKVSIREDVKLMSTNGKNNSFGRLSIIGGKKVTLASDALVQGIEFLGNSVFDIDVFNLELLEADFNSVTGWGTSKMFKTAGDASNGGLTLPVVFNGTNGIKQIFPMGTYKPGSTTVLGYYPTEISANNSPTAIGTITVKPVNNYHPSVNKPADVLQYYWRTSSVGFNGLNDNSFSYKYTYADNIGGSINKAIVLYDKNWVEEGNVSGSNITFPSKKAYSLGDYSVGNNSAFKDARVLYSRNSGNFNDRLTWSDISHTGVELKNNEGPEPFDYYIIAPNHTVTIHQNNARGAQVEIKGVLQVNNNTSGHQISIIKGNGRLKYINNFTYFPSNFIISGDYTEFSNTETAVLEFAGSGTYHLPANTVIPYYPNLHISGGGTKNTPYNGSVYINGELFVDNASLSITGIHAGVLSIGNDLRINTGTLTLSSTGNHHTNVGGDILIQGATGRLRGGNSNNLYLTGNIYQNAGFIEFNNSNKTNVYFVGDNPAEFVSQVTKANSSFYTITVDKESANSKVHFKNGFVFAIPGDARPLKLMKGVAHLDNNTIDVILNSGTTDFQIPSTSTLIVDNGSKVRAGGSNSSLFLDGALVVDNGGEFLWIGTGGNHVKYSASGNASIWIGADAKFHLGSQLFRNADGGILKFTQSSATSDVRIATVNAPLTQKGVFEVLNGGSSFVQSEVNSEINILRGQSGTNPVPSVVFNPDASSIANGSKIIMGDASDANKISLISEKAMGGIDVVGASNVELLISPLTLNGSLNVGAGSTFTANDLDVILKGYLLVDGSYSAGINTTYFSGTSDQMVTGTVDFYNLSKLAGFSSLTMHADANVEVSNNFSVEKGSIVTGVNNLVVKGNASVLMGASVGGIELSGPELQLLSGGGNIGRLVINNEENVMVPSQPDAIIVTNKLVLEKGIFDIGRNLLQLGKDAVVVDKDGGSNFSADNMIQTFLSFTDAGIRKYFPAISSPTTFIYPIGSQNKYTPVTFVIDEITSANGYIRVKAANERHISVIDDPETAMIEPDNVLRYYWTIDAKDITGFKAKVNMQAYANDVAPPTEGDNYIVARILANNDLWNKENLPAASVEGERIFFDNANSKLVFNGYFFNGTNDIGISGDYTAGLPSAIPDRVPTYISVAPGGEWNVENTWAVYNPVNGAIGSAGVGVQQNGPLGSIVYIRENVNVTTNGRIAYRTHIEENGTLNVGSTINNRLGNVSGKGRLRVESGSLPAGFYEEFAQPAGGVFEYSGTGSYSVLGGINTLNSVELTGIGERKLPDGTIRLHGNFLIDGPSVNMRETTQVQIGRNFTFNNGQLDLGAESQFVFNGTLPQTVGGSQSFTGANALYNVIINNPAGVEIATNLTINKHLQLDRGIVSLGGGVILHLGAETTTAGASDNSFVNGFLSKFINGNESFEFPVGDQGRYGAFGVADKTPTGGTWVVKYNDATPPNRDQKVNIAYVSNNEYWELIAPSAGAIAAATLRWDEESGINPDVFDVVTSEPHLASPVWSVVNKQNVDKLGQKVAVANLAHNLRRYFSFGLQTMPEVGDYTWKGLESADWFNPANWYGAKVPSAGTPALITTVDLIQAPTNWPVIEGSNIAQVNNLTIETGTNLTLNPGGKLTVNGDLSIADDEGLRIINNYGPSGMASLITLGEISGTGSTHIRMTLAKNQWFYVGSSIKGAKIGDFSPAPRGSGTFTNFYRDMWYSPNINHSTWLLRTMEGLAVFYHKINELDLTKELSYTGVLNNGLVQRTYVENRYQLMANPYPSFIDWQSGEGWTRGDFESTVWYRMKVGEAMTFITYNYGSVPGARLALYPEEGVFSEAEFALIPPMQSVYVRPLKAGANLVVENESRRHGLEGSRLKSSGGRYGDVVRIVSDNGVTRDGTVIYFAQGSEEGIDAGDSEKFKNDDARVPEIFTRVDGKEVSINGLPALVTATRIIPLSVRNQQLGEVSISFDLSYYYGMHSIYLEDKYTGAFVNVAQNDSYTYQVESAGLRDDRFVLHFYQVSTDLENPKAEETDAGSTISIKSLAGKVLVSVGMDLLQNGPGNVEIYTIEGRKISEVPAHSSRTLVILPNESGVYIIRAKFGNLVKSERVIGVFR